MSDTIQKHNEKCWDTIGVLGDKSCPELTQYVTCRNCPELILSGRSLFDRPVPDSLLREWSSLYELEKETEKPGSMSGVVFRLGEEWFCLGAQYFESIVEDRKPHTIPHRTNRFFLGVVNVNGELLLCISLKNLLGIAANSELSDENTCRMMIVTKDSERFALQVDEIMTVARFLPEDMRRLPVNISKFPESLTSGIFDIAGKDAGWLDDTKLFDSLRRGIRF